MHPLINRITTAVCGISTLLLFLDSICELILAGTVRHRLHVAFVESTNWYYNNVENESAIPYIPYDIQDTGHFIYNASQTEIAAGALGLVAAVVVAVYMILVGRGGSMQRSKIWHAAVVLLILYVVAAMIAIIAIFGAVSAAESNATTPYFKYELLKSENVMVWELQGWGDTTSWQKYTCKAAQLVGGWFVSTCAYQRGALYNLIPLMVLSILTTLLFILKTAFDVSCRPKVEKEEKMDRPEMETTAQGARV